MPDLVNRTIAATLNAVLRVCLLPGLNRPGVYAVRGLPQLQPLLARLARHRAASLFSLAKRRCPAYAEFLQQQAFTATPGPRTLDQIPETRKDNYVKKFSIESRCLDGRIPSRGVVVDESSGSGGEPTAWVRGPAERAGVRRMLHHAFAARFGDQQLFLLNCFALGPWATGMNVSMAFADVLISQAIGPDKAKLEHTLRTFGPRYTYAITGYPPFIRDFLATTTLDLSSYRLHLLLGGEGMSEPLRDTFLKSFATVYSSYGASDLEINLAAETDFTIAVRRLCHQNPERSKALFGRPDPPMLFQYDALNYLIQVNQAGELVFTLLRPGFAAPKIRYNLRDLGGALPFRELAARLSAQGIDVRSLPRAAAFPILFVYGRSDMTIPFYGAKIFVADVAGALAQIPALAPIVQSFQLRRATSPSGTDQLLIHLELTRTAQENHPAAESARDQLLERLRQINQDFREVSRAFAADQVVVTFHPFGTGPFATRDTRVKNRYLDS